MDLLMQCEGITKKYSSGGADFLALDGVSVEIGKGGFTILKGRSGSGKTTLINILGALDQPTEGSVLFEGRDITKMSETERVRIRQKEFGFVFQSVALVSMMTALENVEFGLKIAGYPAGEAAARAKACLELVGLGPRMKHMAQELSGGEQQRVAIARAFAHKPKLIFADEPTAELDTNTGLAVVKVFTDLIRTEGATIVMATHDPGLMEIADTLYLLEGGVVCGH